MTLRYLNDPPMVWQGERLANGQSIPRNAEEVMSNAELNAFGLGREVQVRPEKTRAQVYVEPPIYAVAPAGRDQVITATWGVRDKTPAEIEEMREAAIPPPEDAMFTTSFDHENRILALEGKPAMTPLQYRELLKSRGE